jgi:hypothetical protein
LKGWGWMRICHTDSIQLISKICTPSDFGSGK